MEKLQQHLWPGNVRELRNTLERSLLFMEGDTLDGEDILLQESHLMKAHSRDDLPAASAATSAPGDDLLTDPAMSLQDRLDAEEKQILHATLTALDWDIAQATTILGLSRSRLYSRIKKYELQRP